MKGGVIMSSASSPASGMNIIYNWNKGKWIFKDIYNLGYPYYHIHPYKQKAAKHMVDQASCVIDYIIIFGSSVTTWHRQWKDLDVVLVGDAVSEIDTRILLNMKIEPRRFTYDILTYTNLSEISENANNLSKLSQEILNKGVMVYGKG